MLHTDQLCTDQCAQPALIYPCYLRFERRSPSLRSGGAHPYYTLRYYTHLPFLPPSNMAACQGQVHAFDSQDLIDVYIPDGPETIIYRCEQQLCPNRTPRSIAEDYPRYKVIRRAQHPLGPRSTLTSRSASWHSCPVSPSSRLPQTVVAGPSQAQGDLPPDPVPEPEPKESASEEGVSESESADPTRPASPAVLAPTSAVPD
ncbi:hypothetical protein POSPLADRAFT_1103206, partial [Postia placenta MAD-698-R-SB12]